MYQLLKLSVSDASGERRSAFGRSSRERRSHARICTTGDTCSGGVCAGGAPPNCDDGNVCTDDSCNPATGCVNANNIAPCDDGDACTTADTCALGVCVGGAPPACDDGNVCTPAGDPCTPLFCDEVGDACVPVVASPNARGIWDVALWTSVGESSWEGVETTLIGGTITVSHKVCRKHQDCNDHDACTNDTCVAGVWEYVRNERSCGEAELEKKRGRN